MDKFLDWWYNRVKGQYLTNRQYEAVVEKMIENEEICANV